jgi:RNA polymerase sigma factor (sigma-70 family)
LNPWPDLYYGEPEREDFLEAIREIDQELIQAVAHSPRRESNRCEVAPFHSDERIALDLGIPPEKVMEKCRVALRRLLRNFHLPPWVERDELISEAYQAVYRTQVSELTHVSTVAYSAMIDWLRKEGVRRRGRVELPDSDNDSDNGCNPVNSDESVLQLRQNTPGVIGRNARVSEALKALPPRQYNAVQLLFWKDCSHAETAQRMSTTIGAVKMLKSRAEANLKSVL